MLLEPIKGFVFFQRDAVRAGITLGGPAVRLRRAGRWRRGWWPSGLTEPVFVGAPAGDPRLFIVEKGGADQGAPAGRRISTFLDIGPSGANLINATGERGLLGLAFDPNFATPGDSRVRHVLRQLHRSRQPQQHRESPVTRCRATRTSANAASRQDGPHRDAALRLEQPQGGLDRFPAGRAGQSVHRYRRRRRQQRHGQPRADRRPTTSARCCGSTCTGTISAPT